MNSMRLTYKHSHKTLWFGLAGTVVVIVGSILFGVCSNAEEGSREDDESNQTSSQRR